MGLVDTLKRFKKERVQEQSARIIVATIQEFSSRLVTEWTPYGDPLLWKAPPPADYRPGNLQSSWFLSIGGPSFEKTDAVTHREVHHLDRLADFRAGETICLSNSAPHAGAAEGGHSTQAPVGILVNAFEFEPIAYNVARRIAG